MTEENINTEQQTVDEDIAFVETPAGDETPIDDVLSPEESLGSPAIDAETGDAIVAESEGELEPEAGKQKDTGEITPSEEEGLRALGITGVTTYKGAAEKFAEHIKSGRQDSDILSRANKVFEERGLGDLSEALKLIEVSGKDESLKETTFVSQFFGNYENQIKAHDVELKRQLDAGEIEESEYKPGLTAFNQNREFLGNLVEALSKDMMGFFQRTYGDRLDAGEQKSIRSGLETQWAKLPEKTRNRWEKEKEGLISHIASNTKLHKAEKPFAVGIGSYLATKEFSDPANFVYSGDNLDEKIQAGMDAKVDEARKHSAESMARSLKAGTRDELPEGASDVEIEAFRQRKLKELDRVIRTVG